jgi:hypothetical protein
VVLLVRECDLDAVVDSRLSDPLEVRVERQPDAVARQWLAYEVGRAHRLVGGVERLRCLAVGSAQVSVIRLLDPGNADGADAGQILASIGRIVQAVRGDRPDVPDQVGVDRADGLQGRVVAQIGALELDPGETAVALGHVRELAVGNRERQHDRIALVHLDPGLIRLPHLLERLLDHPGQAREHKAPGLSKQLRLLVRADAVAVGVGRERRRVHLDGDAGAARDEHPAVPVDDVAPLRRDIGRAHLALRRGGRVLAGMQHLERPEPEEEDGEEDRRDHAKRRRADGERERIRRRLGPRRGRLDEHDSAGTRGETGAG